MEVAVATGDRLVHAPALVVCAPGIEDFTLLTKGKIRDRQDAHKEGQIDFGTHLGAIEYGQDELYRILH